MQANRAGGNLRENRVAGACACGSAGARVKRAQRYRTSEYERCATARNQAAASSRCAQNARRAQRFAINKTMCCAVRKREVVVCVRR